MIKLDFKISDRYLVFHTLIRSGSNGFIVGAPKEDIRDVVAFQNYAWEQSEAGYNFLRFGIDVKNNIIGNQSISDLSKKADELLNSLVNSPQYQKIKLQTEKALQKVKAEWESNYEKTHQIMGELSGIELDNFFEIYIAHPSQKNGRNLGDNVILWSYRLDWPNYNTIYLWHEILHSYIEKSDVGHDNLNELRAKLLNSWSDYIKQPEKDIVKFIEEAKKFINP